MPRRSPTRRWRRCLPPSDCRWIISMEGSSQARRRPPKWCTLLLLGFVLLICLLLWKFPPTESSWWPKCIFHQLTGLLCPGCGATRSMRCFTATCFTVCVVTSSCPFFPLRFCSGGIALPCFAGLRCRFWSQDSSVYIGFCVISPRRYGLFYHHNTRPCSSLCHSN